MRIVIILFERYAVSIFLTSNAKTLRMNCSIEMRIFCYFFEFFSFAVFDRKKKRHPILSDAENTKKYQ